MMRKHDFVPSAMRELEPRVLLSHASKTPSVVVSGLHPGQQVLNSKSQTVVAEVNQAFASFANDYGQARATYFSSIAGQAAPGAATTAAFKLYTTQRVSVLAEQLISSFLQSSYGTARVPGHYSSLKQLISTKIIGTDNQAPAGSLLCSLYQTLPQPGTSAPTESLYSLSQDEAIEAAQVTVVNTVNVLKVGDFGNKTAKHG